MQIILPPSGNTIKILGKPKLAEHGLRWMTYVLAQPVEGGVLVFHTLTRALLLLTPEEYAAPDNLPELRDGWFRVPQEILLGQIVLSATGRFLSEYTSAAVENRFKHRLFSALLTGDYASVAAVHSGEWMNRLTSDTTVVAGGVTQIVPGLIGMLVRLLGAVAAILWLEPRFLYILLPGGAAMMLLTYAFRKILKRLHKRIQETDGALRVFLQERLESLVIVRTFAKEEQMARQADALMDAHKAARMKRSNFSNLCNIGFAGAMDGAYLLGIGFCGYGILTGTMSYGNLMAIMQLVGQVQSPFANLTGYLPRYYSMLASAERLMEAEAFAPDSTETVPEEQTLHFYQTECKLTFLQINQNSTAYHSNHRRSNPVKYLFSLTSL